MPFIRLFLRCRHFFRFNLLFKHYPFFEKDTESTLLSGAMAAAASLIHANSLFFTPQLTEVSFNSLNVTMGTASRTPQQSSSLEDFPQNASSAGLYKIELAWVTILVALLTGEETVVARTVAVGVWKALEKKATRS